MAIATAILIASRFQYFILAAYVWDNAKLFLTSGIAFRTDYFRIATNHPATYQNTCRIDTLHSEPIAFFVLISFSSVDNVDQGCDCYAQGNHTD